MWTQHNPIYQTAKNLICISANMLNFYFYSIFNCDNVNDDNTIAISSEDHTALLETISDVMLTKAEVWYVLRMINEDKPTSPDKTPRCY